MDYAKACMDEHPSKVKRDERISREEIRKLYDLPLMDLVYRAASVHREHWDPNGVQMSTLVSIKTGACVEDCSYCTQSSRYETETKYEPLMQVQEVMKQAHAAKASGSNRLCMGAAWREVKDGPQFDSVLEMVRGVKALGMEACVTLGMLNESQASRLREAGLDYYNHNLDTGPDYYDKVVTTRTYADRLATVEINNTFAEKVFFVKIDDDTKKKQIFSITADGKLETALVNQEEFRKSNCFNPAVSPDGNRLLFVCDQGVDDQGRHNNDIYMINADGTNLQRLTQNPSDDIMPAWSPAEEGVVIVAEILNNKSTYNTLELTSGRMAKVARGITWVEPKLVCQVRRVRPSAL